MKNNIKGRIGNLGNKETMAKNLKRYLDSRGLNPHQFSEIMGFKYTTVMNWIKGNSYPRIDKIELMAMYFGIDKSDLVEEFTPVSITLDRINKVSSKLNEPRQTNVLNYATNQLSEQEDEISESENQIYAYIDEILDRQVAWQGQKLSEEGREAVREGIKKFLDENPDRLPKL